MFDSSLKLSSASEGRRAGPFSLAATAHLLVLIPAGAISLLMVEEVVLPRDPTEIAVFRVSVADRVVQPRQAGDPVKRSNAGPHSSTAETQLRSRIPSAPPGEPKAPKAPPEYGLRELDSVPEPLEYGDLEDSGFDGGPTGSRFGLPGGNGAGPGVRGVDGDGPGGGNPIPVTPDVEAPQLIRKVLPDYPIIARTARVSGTVFVKAVISPSGRVVDVEVVSSASPLLNESALLAVREWEYRPARRNGEPVAVYFTVRVDFILQ